MTNAYLFAEWVASIYEHARHWVEFESATKTICIAYMQPMRTLRKAARETWTETGSPRLSHVVEARN